MDVLTDGWELRGCLGDTWRWLSGPGRPEGEPGWLPARVPGSVLDDLHEAGVVPDPYHGTNTLLSEWVPQRTWLYRRTLTVPPRGPGGRVLLHFDGVDHEATVLVDGAWAAHHTGMYTPFTCDITDRVPPGGGSVLLAVAVHPAPAGEPQVGRTDRVRTHKSRMGYGWDFCPRMVHQGVWKPVRMEVAGPARLAGTTVAATLSDDHAHGTVDVTARVDATAPGSVHVTVRDPEQRIVARTEVRHPAGAQEVPARLDVPEPRLWWPNGHGDRPLYAVTVELRDGTGKTVGRAERHCGFRRIALRPNPGAPADALPYTLEVNGRPLYAKGWNWVPLRRPVRCRTSRTPPTPAHARRRRTRDPAARMGRGAHRERGVLRRVRPAGPAGVAGVQPVQFRHRQRALGRPRLPRADGGRGADTSFPRCATTPRSRCGDPATNCTTPPPAARCRRPTPP